MKNPIQAVSPGSHGIVINLHHFADLITTHVWALLCMTRHDFHLNSCALAPCRTAVIHCCILHCQSWLSQNTLHILLIYFAKQVSEEMQLLPRLCSQATFSPRKCDILCFTEVMERTWTPKRQECVLHPICWIQFKLYAYCMCMDEYILSIF